MSSPPSPTVPRQPLSFGACRSSRILASPRPVAASAQWESVSRQTTTHFHTSSSSNPASVCLTPCTQQSARRSINFYSSQLLSPLDRLKGLQRVPSRPRPLTLAPPPSHTRPFTRPRPAPHLTSPHRRYPLSPSTPAYALRRPTH